METLWRSPAPETAGAKVGRRVTPPPSGQRHPHGINSCPGPDDDGWAQPAPVVLPDQTRLFLYKDGEALQAAYDAIKAAERLICLEVYIFASDDTGRAFAQLLSEKARAGVKTFVIYDSFGSIASDAGMFDLMRGAGVRLQEFHPIRPWDTRYSWRPFNRDHRKLLVIDRKIAGIGGLNIGREYGGQWVVRRQQCYEAWRDTAVGIVGPGAGLFQNAFVRAWQYVMHGGRIRRAEFHEGIRGQPLGVLASVATLNSPLRRTLCELMSGAKRSIDMTMAYFAPDDELVDELCSASKRGVQVRLMLPGQCDVPLVRIAARSFYEKLMGCGIEIYERSGVVLHAKTMVIDQAVTMMGSTNLDYRSIEYNCEISAIVRSHEFGKQMRDLFENDIHFAKKIEPHVWKGRPIYDRVVQWAVSRARYLL
jgi:cardiolipin synthase